MKKVLLLIALTIISSISAYAQDEISFIYLNGSNTNTIESKEDFIKGVEKLHTQIIKNFSNDELINEKMFEKGKYKINSIPYSFYWGDLSKDDIETIKEDFDFMKKISPKPANYVRNFIAMCLHDAIWVSKMENMYPIIKKLHSKVIEENKQNNKVVLVGYSAGTFIVQQYLSLKAPIIKFKEEILKRPNIKQEFKDYISNKDIKDTCVDAVFNTNLITYNIEHNFTFEDDFESYKTKIDNLNKETEEQCMPQGALAGGINYASPYALFYSNLFDPNYKMHEIMAMSYKYIVENNMFWLTVNYSDDPLGFPVSKNVNFDEIKNITNLQINPNGGFVYDKSDKPSRRTFVMAHLAYFKTAKRYAKIVTEAYKEGYKHFYMTNNE